MNCTRLFAAAAALALATTAGAQTGPTNYWRFDESSTSVAYDAAGAANGALTGRPARLAGVASRALGFDGADDVVSLPQAFPFHAAGDVTMMLWAYRADDEHRTLAWTRPEWEDSNRFHFFSGWLAQCFEYDTNRFGFGIDYRDVDTNLHTVACAETPANTWTHLALVRAGNVYSFYVDGVLASEIEDAVPALPTNSSAWQLGAPYSIARYQGGLDELAFYGRALTAEEVQARYLKSSLGQGYEDADAAVTGCLAHRGVGVAGAKVSLTQSGASAQAATANALGCYNFKKALQGKPAKVTVEGTLR